MPLQATSGAASYDAFGGGAATAANYIEDMFQTWLYTGNGSTQTINNGIDLAGKGGLVWIKNRDTAGYVHRLFDSARGNNSLTTSSTAAQVDFTGLWGGLTSTGFSIAATQATLNESNKTYASWTFREQPKFFDVVTYTGNGSGARNISHNLNSAPGCIIVKCTSTTSNWMVWHRSISGQDNLYLNATDGTSTVASDPISVPGFPSSLSTTEFTVSTGTDSCNDNGATYVAYLFAHNAGGFGRTGTDNVISCGSYVETTGPNAVNLGYEPQFLLLKNASSTSDWWLVDTMRGMTADGQDALLRANTTDAELSAGGNWYPTATGFANDSASGSGNTWIYIAIRRGPMKTPTTGTSVYQASYFGSGAAGTPAYISGFPPDFAIHGGMIDGSTNKFATDRLRGTRNLFTNLTNSEGSNASNIFYQNGFYDGLGSALANYFAWMFRRAPGFMDVCCYTGNGINGTTQSHNLGVVPEMWIVKRRSTADSWVVGTSARGSNVVELNLADGEYDAGTAYFSNGSVYTAPTSSVIWLGSNARVNQNGGTFVAYLFASCPGVSKVGSYTGTGTTQVINCGFTAGSRFVLIKRTDSTGDWYVWDSARGIVAGNDPYLLLNSTAAEVTSTDFVDTAATGFELSSTAPAALNANGGTYIFLAIA